MKIKTQNLCCFYFIHLFLCSLQTLLLQRIYFLLLTCSSLPVVPSQPTRRTQRTLWGESRVSKQSKQQRKKDKNDLLVFLLFHNICIIEGSRALDVFSLGSFSFKSSSFQSESNRDHQKLIIYHHSVYFISTRGRNSLCLVIHQTAETQKRMNYLLLSATLTRLLIKCAFKPHTDTHQLSYAISLSFINQYNCFITILPVL